MAHILILGGGAAGLAAALAAAQTDPTARVTVLERSPRPGKKLLATGNGRCNLDNEGITPESYSSADRAAPVSYTHLPLQPCVLLLGRGPFFPGHGGPHPHQLCLRPCH